MIQKELENSIVHKRRAWKDYLTYEENMEEIGEAT